MNFARIKMIADALLYEGYILYPYRASAMKNQQRFNFGVIEPRGSGGASKMRTECLVQGASPTVEVQIRFLQVVSRQACRVLESGRGLEDASNFEPVTSLTIDDDIYPTWQEVVERDIPLGPLSIAELLTRAERREFGWLTHESQEELRDQRGVTAGIFQRCQATLQLAIEVRAVTVQSGLVRLAIEITNTTSPVETSPTAAIMQSLVSTHTMIAVSEGNFISLLEPDDAFAAAAADCNNLGTWPVLVSDRDRADMMLSSPIILYDYPQIAPESGGDFFDGTEIDEILTLRVQTLTELEKREMRHVDDRARRILDRADSLDMNEFGKLHGTVRAAPWSMQEIESRPRMEQVECSGSVLRIGSRVRLCPKASADVMDIVLQGQIATIEAIEQDYEENIHLAVVIDDDPGRDLGLLRLPGHRFFYSLDEVEPLDD